MWKSIRNSVFRFATPCFTFFRNKIILTMIYSFLHLIYSFCFISFHWIPTLLYFQNSAHGCCFSNFFFFFILQHTFLQWYENYYSFTQEPPFHVYQSNDDQCTKIPTCFIFNKYFCCIFPQSLKLRDQYRFFLVEFFSNVFFNEIQWNFNRKIQSIERSIQVLALGIDTTYSKWKFYKRWCSISDNNI